MPVWCVLGRGLWGISTHLYGAWAQQSDVHTCACACMYMCMYMHVHVHVNAHVCATGSTVRDALSGGGSHFISELPFLQPSKNIRNVDPPYHFGIPLAFFVNGLGTMK